MSSLALLDPGSGGLPWLDIVGLVLIGALSLLGFIRGLWWQVVRLLGIAASVFAARSLAPLAAPTVLETFPKMPERLGHGLVWFGIFVLGLVAVSLVGLLGKKSLEAMQLGFADRMGGALAGLVTAILIHGSLLIGLMHLGPEEWSQNAMHGTTSRMLLDTMARKVPLLVDSETAKTLEPWLSPDGGSVYASDGSEAQRRGRKVR